MTELQDVQLGRVQVFTGFPACRFFLASIQSNLKSNAPFYERPIRYTIEIIQEITQKDIAVAEANFQDAVEAVMNRLNTQWTLGDNVDVSDIDIGDVREEEFTFGPCQVIGISFTATTHYP